MNTIGQLKQSEKQFEQAVRQLAEAKGWLVGHFSDSRREVVNRSTGERRLVGDSGAKGFPDLVMARRGRIIFAELKAAKGRLSGEQKEWLVALGGESDGSVPVEVALRCQIGSVRSTAEIAKWVRCWRPEDWPEIERVLA